MYIIQYCPIFSFSCEIFVERHSAEHQERLFVHCSTIHFNKSVLLSSGDKQGFPTWISSTWTSLFKDVVKPQKYPQTTRAICCSFKLWHIHKQISFKVLTLWKLRRSPEWQFVPPDLRDTRTALDSESDSLCDDFAASSLSSSKTPDCRCSHFRTGPPHGIGVSSPHPDDCVPLFIRHPLIPGITLNSIPMWPLGASSASHFSNHCHWIALHSTGWHNTPVIRHEGHWLCTAAGLDKGCFFFCVCVGGLFVYLFIFLPHPSSPQGPFFLLNMI